MTCACGDEAGAREVWRGEGQAIWLVICDPCHARASAEVELLRLRHEALVSAGMTADEAQSIMLRHIDSPAEA